MLQSNSEPITPHHSIRTAWIYLILSVLLLALKFLAYSLTGSKAVLSDAIESIINVIAALMALVVMRAVAEPADHQHPYGHGKLEYFSSAFEGGMIAFAALAISYEAIQAMIKGSDVRQIEVGALIMGASAVVNLLLGRYLLKVGRANQSEALKASGTHVLSDVWTTGGVIVGLALVKVTGMTWLDPLVALVVACLLGYSGYTIVRQSAGGLIDEFDAQSVLALSEAMNLHRHSGVIDFHNTRIIRAGRFHHVDIHMVVPDFWDALHVHTVCHNFEKNVVESYPFEGEFAFHVDPCQKEYCSRCDLLECSIRKNRFTGLRPFTVDSITAGPMKDIDL